MEIREVYGDLLDTECDVIAHQVNCMGVMGSGVAKAIKEKYPEVFSEYKNAVTILENNLLGGCLVIKCNNGKYVANLAAQYFYKNCCKAEEMLKVSAFNQPDFDRFNENITPTRFTNYEALCRALELLKLSMIRNNLSSVAFPKYMGAARGGGDWDVVKSIITSVFKETNILIEYRH